MREFKQEIFLIYQELMDLKNIKEVENYLISPKDRINIVDNANNNLYYPTLLDKISFVYFTIVHNHYFSDWNKRTWTLFLITNLYKYFNFNIDTDNKKKYLKKLAISIANWTIKDWRIVKNKLVLFVEKYYIINTFFIL